MQKFFEKYNQLNKWNTLLKIGKKLGIDVSSCKKIFCYK